MKKLLFALFFLAFPATTHASCDLSSAHIRNLAQTYINTNYSYNNFGLKKPKLIVSNKRVYTYYAEELNGVITIYQKEFKESYCDQYYDGLTPFVQEVINHEYIHYLDEKMHLSKKIGEATLSENTAYVGEHVFQTILWPNSFTRRDLRPRDVKKYAQLLKILHSKIV